MFADDLGLDEGRTNLEPPREMEAKAQGIEESAAARHTLVAGEASGEVRQNLDFTDPVNRKKLRPLFS